MAECGQGVIGGDDGAFGPALHRRRFFAYAALEVRHSLATEAFLELPPAPAQLSGRHIGYRGRLIYGIDASPDLVSAVTDVVLEEIAEWQNRQLEVLCPLVFFDAIRVKIRDEGTVRNKAVYVALDVHHDGTKDILGLWIEQNEGAKFWLRVMNEPKNRGVENLLIAMKRTFIVSDKRSLMSMASRAFRRLSPPCFRKRRCKPVSCIDPPFPGVRLLQGPQSRCRGAEDYLPRQGAEAGHAALEVFAEGPWNKKYPAIAPVWRRAWTEVIPFYAFPDEVRKIIYTTDAIESP